MPLIPVGEFTPDATPYLAGGLPAARNTVPRVDGADGPMRGASVLSDALAEAARGGLAARSRDGTSYVLAGTETTLNLLVGAAWDDRSGATYAVPVRGAWQFCQFGELVIATNLADDVQSFTLGSGGNFAALAAGAPRARYVAAVEPGFVMLGYYDDGGGAVAGGLWWSGINDATLWPTIGTLAATSVQSDAQTLATGGAVTGIVPAIGGAQAVIFTEGAIYRVDYIGPPQIFAFREIERSRGCICPYAIASVNGQAFFISEDGFHVCNGTAAMSIGAGKVDRFFSETVDKAQLHAVTAAVDYERNLIVWSWPTVGAVLPNRWLVFNYVSNRWRYGDDAALTVQMMMPARTPAVTLDVADAYADDIDAAGAPSLDAPIYAGGVRRLSGFDASNRLITFSGAPVAARIETGDTDADGRRVFVSGLRPATDAATVTARVGGRELLSQPVIYSASTGRAADGWCPQRTTGRYVRAVTEIPAGVEWSYVQGVDVRMKAEGMR